MNWGSNGNPHSQGQGYVANHPSFENITQYDDTRQALIKAGYPEATELKTKEQREADLGKFFNKHLKPRHPSQDAGGNPLYPFKADLLKSPDFAKPQTVDLLELLEGLNLQNKDVDLDPLRRVVLFLIGDVSVTPVMDTKPDTWSAPMRPARINL